MDARIDRLKQQIFYERCRISAVWILLMEIFCVGFVAILLNINFSNPTVWLNSCSQIFSLKSLSIFILLSLTTILKTLLHTTNLSVWQISPTSRWALMWKVLRPSSLIQIILNLFIGLVITKLCVGFVIDFDHSVITTKDGKPCLNEICIFLICHGVFASLVDGVLYFTQDRFLVTFPLVQQGKRLKIKYGLMKTIVSSSAQVLKWMRLFLLAYILGLGYPLKLVLINVSNVENWCDSSSLTTLTGLLNIKLLWLSWLTASMVCFLWQSVCLFITTFLTQRWMFDVEHESSDLNQITLHQALNVEAVPLIQCLSCLDLFYLAQNGNSKRKQDLFAISHPGGHPYNWKNTMRECITLLQTLNAKLKYWTDDYQLEKPTLSNRIPDGELHSMKLNPFVTVTLWIQRKLSSTIQKTKAAPFTSDMYISTQNHCTRSIFAFCQPHIWVIQALSLLVIYAVKVNKFGVVQEEFPEIITVLADLEKILDKHNQRGVPVHGKSPFLDVQREAKLKKALTLAVKTSLNRLAWYFYKSSSFLAPSPQLQRSFELRASGV